MILHEEQVFRTACFMFIKFWVEIKKKNVFIRVAYVIVQGAVKFVYTLEVMERP